MFISLNDVQFTNYQENLLKLLELCIINNFTRTVLSGEKNKLHLPIFKLKYLSTNINLLVHFLCGGCLEMDARDFIPINGLTLCGGLATGDDQTKKSTEDGKYY